METVAHQRSYLAQVDARKRFRFDGRVYLRNEMFFSFAVAVPVICTES
jgi:hypothetical protein